MAVAQMEVKAGDPEANVAKMLELIEEAKKQKVDVLVFPEMCVGGYLLGDDWNDDDHCEALMAYNDKIRAATQGIAVAWGNVFLDTPERMAERGIDGHHPNKDGHTRRYNAVYVAQNGQWCKKKVENDLMPKGVHAKTLLPTYSVFDDQRYFFSTEDVAKDFGVSLKKLEQPFVVEVNGKKVPIGFQVCEDMWAKDYRAKGEALNVARMLIDNGARYLVNLSSSPWKLGKEDARDGAVSFLKEELGDKFVPFVYANHTGVQNNGKNFITFDGGSTVYGPDGKPVQIASASHGEELMVIDNLRGPAVSRPKVPAIAQKYQAIMEGLRHLGDLAGQKTPRFVIGLSGGIDSAVVAALLVKAVGKDNVFAVNMPTVYNSEKTKGAAKQIAEKLGISYQVVPIQELVDLNTKVLDSADLDGKKKKLSDLNEENVQAKLRGTTLLSNLAAKYDAFFTNNGNKLEVALGYATLYGDWGGAVSVLGDLTKKEVYELAKYLNELFGQEVIPSALIPDELFRFKKDQIAPSAELKNAQVDPMKFGYHDALLDRMEGFDRASPERIMEWYLAGTLHTKLGISPQLMSRWGVDDPKEFLKDLEWFAKKVHGAVFKRVQAPPVILTSGFAYGFDHRESIKPFSLSAKAKTLATKISETMTKYQPAEKKAAA
jgi:NAD+ synthase (glutamine-hydrolysing)